MPKVQKKFVIQEISDNELPFAMTITLYFKLGLRFDTQNADRLKIVMGVTK
jgi:hypothetical protein